MFQLSSILYLLFFGRIVPIHSSKKKKKHMREPGKPEAWDGKDTFSVDEDPDESLSQPYPPKTDSYNSKETSIFVGISSFRDSRCPKTLYNLFTKAINPHRVTIGLVQQNALKDIDCVEKFCELMGFKLRYEVIGNKAEEDRDRMERCPHFSQINVNRVSHLLARGPTFGRHLQIYLLKDEEFCMQIDSHMDFVQHWDSKMLEQWGMTNNEYGILTTYVHDFADLNKNINGRWEVPNICKLRFIENGLPRNGDAFSAYWLSKPKLGTLWAAGYSFSKCHAERQTPYDPQLPEIFDGEEFSRAARLWTRGYDFYTPHRPYVVHDYNRPKDYDPVEWQNNGGDARLKEKATQRSKKRIFTLLKMPEGDLTEAGQRSLGKYGLGDVRSLDEYEEFMGVNLKTREMLGNKCGTVHWVPFNEDPTILEKYNKPLRWDFSGSLKESGVENVSDELEKNKHIKHIALPKSANAESQRVAFIERKFTIEIPLHSVTAILSKLGIIAISLLLFIVVRQMIVFCRIRRTQILPKERSRSIKNV